jgi:hypothetical protein
MKTADLTGAVLDYWVARADGTDPTVDSQMTFAPSTTWAHGGPIIEREKIMVVWNDGGWIAGVTAFVDGPKGHVSKGPTALIAAMRAYVASKFGDDVSEDAQVPGDGSGAGAHGLRH